MVPVPGVWLAQPGEEARPSVGTGRENFFPLSMRLTGEGRRQSVAVCSKMFEFKKYPRLRRKGEENWWEMNFHVEYERGPCTRRLARSARGRSVIIGKPRSRTFHPAFNAFGPGGVAIIGDRYQWIVRVGSNFHYDFHSPSLALSYRAKASTAVQRQNARRVM